jgi:polyhydroxyalkanoate synthesis regulator phasin
MQDKEIKNAIASILKKEVGALSNVIPLEIINSMANNLSKDFNSLIEKSGYVNKAKYKALQEIADRLEKRIELLEESIK